MYSGRRALGRERPDLIRMVPAGRRYTRWVLWARAAGEWRGSCCWRALAADCIVYGWDLCTQTRLAAPGVHGACSSGDLGGVAWFSLRENEGPFILALGLPITAACFVGWIFSPYACCFDQGRHPSRCALMLAQASARRAVLGEYRMPHSLI
jgi:hypothetical protein